MGQNRRRPNNSPPENEAVFRFYEELNDFLPPESRKRDIRYAFGGRPGIKDPLEALGVPHTEVDLILVNGISRGFDYRLCDGDRVSVYPVFESLDLAPLIRLRPGPLRRTRFVLDVHLGKLARYLRLLGFDTLYRNDYGDPELVRISVEEGRILLTRDRRLLFHRAVTRGYWVRSTRPERQVREVVRRFDLAARIKPFHRCAVCNGIIEPVAKGEIAHRLQPLTRKYHRDFSRCRSCGKIYWKGSHYERLLERLEIGH
ncbi:Mut7-C RNAse domain-containing protein [Kiritimatiella glycovorans]|uniref:Twitching motility protein PilT n=1 Tax=Kiritimatiella glycovorans TaxID=1307763 RepID=A0A0G3EJK9_9BACT|nr:Mut7-C RNAse domain-containing protein [Kiritimatiella glycovorans]AKJ64980.1 hypothetical protein L21SP4_01741 [Kiritimatiella glycovorans]